MTTEELESIRAKVATMDVEYDKLNAEVRSKTGELYDLSINRERLARTFNEARPADVPEIQSYFGGNEYAYPF